jgi:hypothetical protein
MQSVGVSESRQFSIVEYLVAKCVYWSNKAISAPSTTYLAYSFCLEFFSLICLISNSTQDYMYLNNKRGGQNNNSEWDS